MRDATATIGSPGPGVDGTGPAAATAEQGRVTGMDRARSVTPSEVDVSTPSVARMYDFYLGGKDNYEVDRQACAALSEAAPGTAALAINNRRFLIRAVRYLAQEHGIRQFLDHGSGLPTQDNVHQVAQAVDPSARTVYIDNDPIVLAHGRALLEQDDASTVVQADVRDFASVYGDPEVTRLLDFSRPTAALFLSFLHCIPDSDDPAGLVAGVLDRLPKGSAVVISHLASTDPDVRRSLTDMMLANTQGNWGRVRTPDEVEALFGGLSVVEPGIVEVSTWHPDDVAPEVQVTREWIEYGGVAFKN
ncbi:SAM-dependent methyltransferase [Pseudonocardia sp. NPDC049635]|uniref:SAM-dependent methyltransferase n=1 Tax=Pseudonocardia sp. NPDC049635 TaxID=3155506 RepID=UPI0033DAC1EF